ncbi:MAG: hypothetical protein ABIA75_07355 [Candidatus Neomarinimicrobiota bacterium]
MNPWDLALNFKDVVLDFTYLSGFLVLATLLRRYVPLLQKFLIPNNVVAGFFGLLIGSQLLGLINLESARLGQYVYHLLALTFIAIGLRQQKTHWGRGPLSKSFTGLSCYIIQAVIGILVAFGFIYSFWPDLFPGIGFLLPLGFGMGPGIAYTMGHSWEKFGFEGGGMVGLTFSVIGFLIAYFAGIIIVNRGINNRETTLVDGPDKITNDMRTGVVSEDEPKIAGRLTLSTEAIEPLAFQLALIGLLYMLTYGLIHWLTALMAKAGLQDFVDTVWSFHFVVGLLIAIVTRALMDRTGSSFIIDRGLMNRTSGVCMDYLVTASIAAINIAIVGRYWGPILVMSILGGIGTYAVVKYASTRAFDDYHFERFVGIFGEMTGTINSGLVLIRVTDPEFDTPAAEDLAYGGGISLFLGLPLLILLTVPMSVFGNSLRGYWITFGIILIYAAVLWTAWRLIGFIRYTRPVFKRSESRQ